MPPPARSCASSPATADWCHSAAYSPDGKSIVTASDDSTARIWDAATGKELRELTGHSDYVSSAAYSPDGKSIVTASGDRHRPHLGCGHR